MIDILLAKTVPSLILRNLAARGSVKNLRSRAISSTPFSATVEKESLTPLSKHIKDIIKMTGPISVATFMRQALTHPLGGYYMKTDVFGGRGDFITSPEISQLFGEMIGIWLITQWKNMGKPSSIQLVELGPGRGTLMNDITRTLYNFSYMKNAIKEIHLVEPSEFLTDIQKSTLGKNKHLDNVSIQWHDQLEQVPDKLWSMVIAHELFDALPVYKFQLDIDMKWKEIMIDIDSDNLSPLHFRFALSKEMTDASKALLYSLETSTRYAVENFKIGDQIEVSPESWSIAREVAERIKYGGGTGLFIDYGNDEIIDDSLRGIKDHKFTPVLSNVGEADITADVDFSLLKYACEEVVAVYGPITQAHFLNSLGIGTRLKHLLAKQIDCFDVEERKLLISGCNRLVGEGPSGMGNVYKVMAIQPKGVKTPFAFGSDSLNSSSL